MFVAELMTPVDALRNQLTNVSRPKTFAIAQLTVKGSGFVR
jgi:hypothetical protein